MVELGSPVHPIGRLHPALCVQSEIALPFGHAYRLGHTSPRLCRRIPDLAAGDGNRIALMRLDRCL
jgi:hypothetical protein